MLISLYAGRNACSSCRVASSSLCLLSRMGLAHSLWLIGLSSCQLAAGSAWLTLLLIMCFCINHQCQGPYSKWRTHSHFSHNFKRFTLNPEPIHSSWISSTVLLPAACGYFCCVTHSSNTTSYSFVLELINKLFKFLLLLYFFVLHKYIINYDINCWACWG